MENFKIIDSEQAGSINRHQHTKYNIIIIIIIGSIVPLGT